jgi:phosphotransferase system  glucose/maltose/N-acetylglucosamine-specific IIC component
MGIEPFSPTTSQLPIMLAADTGAARAMTAAAAKRKRLVIAMVMFSPGLLLEPHYSQFGGRLQEHG